MTAVAALCAGYGGLELALTAAGIDHHLAWYAEIDPHASTVMAAHTTAPNLGDLCAITDPPPVDLVTAGFPCQPVSTAGARAGVDDARWLIRDVVAVWVASGAHRLILENVPGLFTANDGEAFGQVLDALAEVGASARWACVRASDVGAPHRRERWFCVADADGTGREGARHPQPGGRSRTGLSGRPTADADGWQPERRGGPGELGGQAPTEPGEGDQRERAGHPAGHGGAAAADTDGSGLQRRHPDPAGRRESDQGRSGPWGAYAPAVERWAGIIGRPAPSPTVGGRLNPTFVEWMMGLPPGWVTDCGLSRTQALRVLGNGVVPQQAALALTTLEAA